ncbi:MAG: aminopeptidase P N-terminal domain-containing protein, partial [Candidatus Omnitrophica bacterium]|nr:aminopeptidase P N-terminal domain-containing protein [Candidatus Omnitrophota bacterium]
MIPQREFKYRRSELMRQMKDGVALLVSAPAAVRNHDVEHEYRQDSNFYYFTGFKEPESACLLVPGAKKDKFILFVRPREREREIWTGYRSGVEGAVNDYGAGKAYPIEELPKKLEEYLAGAKMLYYTLGVRPELDKMINEELNRLRAHVRSGASWPTEFRDPSALASEMRLRKSP